LIICWQCDTNNTDIKVQFKKIIQKTHFDQSIISSVKTFTYHVNLLTSFSFGCFPNKQKNHVKTNKSELHDIFIFLWQVDLLFRRHRHHQNLKIKVKSNTRLKVSYVIKTRRHLQVRVSKHLSKKDPVKTHLRSRSLSTASQKTVLTF